MRYRILLLLLMAVSVLISDTNTEKLFQQAQQSFNQEEYTKIYKQLAKDHTDDRYGQLALEELAKIHLLNREYELAIDQLKKIHLQEIEDKQYWLAKAYLKAGRFQESIVSAQIYIAGSENAQNIEVSYFIIADAYLQQGKYQKALNTLESLRNSQYINNHIALLHFKRGNCYELMERFEDAILCYRKLKQDFPYHQYSYLAEDHIYNLQVNNEINIDLTKLKTYRPTEPKIESKAATGKDLKIFLQVGAFSSFDNAENLGKRVKTIGYDYHIFPKIKNSKKLYTVAAGPFENDKKLKLAMRKLENNGLKSFLIKRYD